MECPKWAFFCFYRLYANYLCAKPLNSCSINITCPYLTTVCKCQYSDKGLLMAISATSTLVKVKVRLLKVSGSKFYNNIISNNH